MRILLLGLNYAPEPTGVGVYTTRLARLLSDEGHSVHVVTGLPHYPVWKFSEGYSGRTIEERDGDVRVTRIRHPLPRNTLGPSRVAMEAVFAARSLTVRTEKPDLILAVSPALLTVAAALIRRRWWGGTPVGALSQDLYCRAIAETGALGGRGARLASWLERALFRGADGVSVIHDQFKATLAALGVDAEKITVNRNWTHIGAVPSSAPEFRERHGWRDDETVVLHAGNMGVKQGLENVVSAARLAEQEGHRALRFVMLGDGSRRGHIEGLAAGLTNIEFIDPLPDGEFERALASADVLLLNERSGLREMCVPGKLTSYFAAARPVVAATAPSGAAAGEIEAAGAGVCVAPGDPQALLRAITDIRTSPERAISMGASGFAYSTAVLSEGAATKAYLRWIEDLTSGVDAVRIPSPRAAGRRRTLEKTPSD